MAYQKERKSAKWINAFKNTLFFIAISLAGNSFAMLKLPAVIDDNMVLQRNQVNNIWGWTDAGKEVTVSFRNKIYKTISGRSGEWLIKLDPAKAGAAGYIIVSSGRESITLKNILIGELWLCSGQSNMEFAMDGFKQTYPEEIANANDDNIRYITINNTFDNRERPDAAIKVKWSAISRETIEKCSAVGYFFAKKLRERLKVPVGLVVSSWGGTQAQAWVDVNTLNGFPNYKAVYDTSIKKIDFLRLEEIKKKNETLYQERKALSSASFHQMTTVDYDDNGWEKTKLPGIWEENGHNTLDGIGAYRVYFNVPEGMESKEAVLHLPYIDDVDSSFINGKFIGTWRVWNEPRTYKIPAAVLKAGRNVLTIWVEDTGGGGGMNNDAKGFYLEAEGKSISLAGDAMFKVLAPVEDIAAGVNYASLQNQPSVLFNAMIAPLLHLAFKGVIWYQGESNTYAYVEYRKLFPALISNWRQRFSQKEMPFLFVQLSSFNPNITEPEVSEWAGLREAQTYALKLPKTGMAVTIDVGDQKDIHPQRKKEVGDRLAANAFHIVYGIAKEVYTGPMFSTATVTGNTITISYTNTGSGLITKGDKLMGFAVAGADKKFVPAEAIIKENEVMVSAASIKAPLYVRYAWAEAPLNANLYNKEGFPAAPFRTDK